MSIINKQQEYQDQEEWSDNIQKVKGYKEIKKKVDYWDKKFDCFKDRVIDGPYEIVFDNELGWCIDVDGYVSFNGLDIEEIPFQFRNVSHSFVCGNCEKLKSLKGCPIYVGYDFVCYECLCLRSLEGCPKEIGDSFLCSWCINLVTLKGCPEKVEGYFNCCECLNLTSLEGCPEEVDGAFVCNNCGKKFTEEYVRSLCNVKGNIFN